MGVVSAVKCAVKIANTGNRKNNKKGKEYRAVSKRVHKNLRRKYNLLVAKILGPSYYNSEMNQEAADEATCEAILEAWDKMDLERFGWKIAAVSGWVVAATMFLACLMSMV